MNQRYRWAVAAVLTFGAFITVGVDGQRALPLRASLSQTVPRVIGGHASEDVELSKAEQRTAGMSSYVMRVYSPGANKIDQTAAAFSVYVGYYAEQMRGKTIHSPKNCLPGAGWEALNSSPLVVNANGQMVTVNRYVLQRGKQRAVVLYWYQGRGRVEANEYRVKWNLLRDAAVKRRSDEALVRVVVPASDSEEAATRTAVQVASRLVPAVTRALPDA